MDERLSGRIDAQGAHLGGRIDAQGARLDGRIDTATQEITAMIRADLISLTRALLFGISGMALTVGSLVLAAAHLA